MIAVVRQKQMMMKTDRSDWQFPRDWMVLLMVPAIAVLSSFIFPVVSHALQISPTLFLIALVLAVAGIILLFFARLLFYRKRKHLAFGQTNLPERHRRLYRVAYVCIILSIVIMGTLLAVPRKMANKQGEPTANVGQ